MDNRVNFYTAASIYFALFNRGLRWVYGMDTVNELNLIIGIIEFIFK